MPRAVAGPGGDPGRLRPRQRRDGAVAETRSRSTPPTRPPSSRSPARSAPTSWSSVPRCRWSPASPTRVRAAGIACFGPRAAAAQLEGSKAFAKEVMADGRRPHRGRAGVRGRRRRAARTCARRPRRTSSRPTGWPPARACTWARDLAAAQAFARDVLAEPARGSSSRTTSTARRSACSPSPTARPSSRCCRRRTTSASATATTGPNTGGMGAYAPLPWLPDGHGRRGAARSCCSRSSTRCAQRGTPFAGLLYAGLALTSRGPAGRRVQRPLRRPRDAGRAGAARDAAGRAAARRATGDAGRPPAAALARRRGRDGGRRRRGLPRDARVPGDAVEVGALPAGVDVLHAGTRRATAASSPAAAGCCRSRPRRRPGRGPGRGVRGLAAVRLRGAHCRTDIACAAVDGEIQVRPEGGAGGPLRADDRRAGRRVAGRGRSGRLGAPRPGARDRALHPARDGPGLERGPQVRAVVPGRGAGARGARRGRRRCPPTRRAGARGAAADARGRRRDRGGHPARRHRVPVRVGRQHRAARGRRLRALRHDELATCSTPRWRCSWSRRPTCCWRSATRLVAALRDLGLAHRDTVRVGRTHGIHAEPTSSATGSPTSPSRWPAPATGCAGRARRRGVQDQRRRRDVLQHRPGRRADASPRGSG